MARTALIEHRSERHHAVWPADKLAGTPWIFVPRDGALLSPFNRPSRNAMMSYAERQVADGVVAVARQIASALPTGRWWLYPDGRTEPITQTDPMWMRMLSAQRYVVWLDG